MANSNSIRRRAMGATSLIAISALALGVASGASAQDASASRQAAAPGQDPEVTVDEVIVVGIRGALDQALVVKRNSDTIGEAISADDIGTIPALDIAEALQVIPGVQVNRENDDGQFRLGEISLRGLPGSFTNTTANGQGFAAPSGSVTPAEGEPNAFGAFSSRVFDGVWVNKSYRADLIEGGIAGTVDQRLARALSRPDGQLVVSVGGQYEELADDNLGNFFAAGTKHLIEDRLAVTFRFAHELESFRRDAFNFTEYRALTQDTGNPRGGFYDPAGGSFANWRTANGIGANETVLFPSQFRQYTETQEGHRTSFVGGLEFQVTPQLKLGADILYTNRELDSDSQWLLLTPAGIQTSITPTAAPFAGYTDAGGNTVWVIPEYDYLDITYAQSSRGGSLKQESQGLFLTAEYDGGDWRADASVAYSEAEFLRLGSNYQVQYLANSGRGHTNTNGTFGSVNSGSGDSGDYGFTLMFDPARTTLGTDLGLNYVNPNNPTSNFIQLNVGNGNQRLFNAGNEVYRNRTDKAINANFERDVDWGPISSIRFGGRYNEQTVESYILYYTIAGLNTTGLSNALFGPGPSGFFGGQAPGAYTSGEFEFIDIAAIEAILLANGLNNPNNFAVSPHTGFMYRQDANGNLLGEDGRAVTDTTVSAAYIMANFEDEVFGLDVRGNFGVRHVVTDLEGQGTSLVNGIGTPATAENSYSHTLPALNVSVELTPDVYLRFAYSKALTRPNPAGFTPSTQIEEIPGAGGALGRVDVDLPGTGVDAYTSDNYDISLEWYNRRGSLVSAAIYRKDVNSFIDTRLVCPSDGGGLGFGTLTTVDLGGGIAECRIDGDGREIRISETYNVDSTITIEGMEIAVQQNLDFLENWFLRGFGIQASAAFLTVSDDDSLGNPVNIPRISNRSYNIVGYWENEKFSARAAYNWRSDYFLQGGLSITGAEDRQVAPRGQLDLVARYNFNDDVAVDFRVFNVLEVEYEEYQSGNPMMNRLTAFDGRTYSASLTYKF